MSKKITNNTILGDCKIYTPQIITGMLCGFIVGPRAICDLQKENNIDEHHFSLSIALSSNAGLAFVVGFVGIKIWNNVLFGIALYLIQIFSALLLYFVLNTKKANPLKSSLFIQGEPSILSAILKSVSSAFSTMALICSFNIFSTIFIELISSTLAIADSYKAVLVSLIDFSCAISQNFELNNKLLSLFLTGLSVGFAGFSVHLQTFSVCENNKLNKKLYLSFKFLQGIICGLLAMLLYIF